MRLENYIHLRHILLYHFEKGWKAAESSRDLNELYGDGTISERQAQEWFKRFKSGDTSLEDKPGRGRISDFDDDALLVAVEEDESYTTRILAEMFDVGQATIVRHLKSLGKVWKLAGWVPHELSERNKAERVRIFTELLQRNEREPFLDNLVTGDES
jgi:transposase